MNISKNSHNFLVFLCLILCWTEVAAQPDLAWDKTFGGAGWEELQAMSYTHDGGYLFGGFSSSEFSGDVTLDNSDDIFGDTWLIKTNAAAETIIWQRGFGCEGNERWWDILPTQDGGYLLLGESTSDSCPDNKSEDSRGGKDFWLLKIDGDGNRMWDRTFGGDGNDEGRRILPTNDGNYLLAGFSDSQDVQTSGIGDRTVPSRGGFDYWLVKVSAQGDKLADFAYGGTPPPGQNGNDILFDIEKRSDGTFLLGGHSESNAGFEKSQDSYGRNDFWLVHIDQNGQKIATDSNIPGDYSFGGESLDVIQDVLITKDGNILLTGESSSSPTGIGSKTTPFYGANEVGGEDYWMVKLNDDFSINWQNSFGGTGADIVHTVWENRSGKIWVIGDSNSPASGNKESENIENGKDIWMLLLTPEGDKIWEKTIGGNSNDAPEEILAAHDGGYIIGAHSSSGQGYDKSEDSRGGNDFWLLKTDCSIYQEELVYEANVCKGDPYPLAPVFENCEDCLFTWEDGSDDTVIVVTLTETTDFELLLTDADGCEENAFVQTIVTSNPQILEVATENPPCPDDNNGIINLLEVTGGFPPYEFSINDGSFGTNPEFSDLAPGEYLMTVQDSVNCQTDTLVIIEQPMPPLVDIGEGVVLELGDSLLIQVVTSPGVDTFIWENPDLLSCPTCPETYFQPTETTLLQIEAFNELGCSATDVLLIPVKQEFPYFAPTAFSPDNNGENDTFTIFPSAGVSAIRSFRIFDRWGNQLFSAPDLALNDIRAGWDGMHRGQNAPTGIYIWQAEIEMIDGRKEVISGNVTLFR